MGAGDYRHCIDFEVDANADEDKDEFGSPQPDWQTDFEVWASYEAVGSREFPTNLKRNAEATVRFRMYRRAGVDSARHRIRFTLDPGASPPAYRYFNIFPPLESNNLAEMIIEAEEIL